MTGGGIMPQGEMVIVGLKPKQGKLTFDAEGQEGGAWHSRTLHVPSNTSGLTIGRGYDMKTKNSSKIEADLIGCGIAADKARLIAKAAGLMGPAAKKFIVDNDLRDFEISSEAQVQLFGKSYKSEEDEVNRISAKDDTKKAYGTVDWKVLDGAIKDLVVDLKFRGDYTPGTRKLIQRHLANNDSAALMEVFGNRALWPNVPNDRFERRKAHLKRLIASQPKPPPVPPLPLRKP